MKIYLDNAATTPLDKEVFKAMEPYFLEYFGNPSSSHRQGREVRHAIENSREQIATLLHADPSSILFTSSGTEADNTAICSAIRSHGIKVAITTAFEHHAVLNTLRALEQNGDINIIYLKHDENGAISLGHLEELLNYHDQALVSVMHGNNEIGNLNDIEQIAEVCKRYNAVFHSDTVQTMGHYRYKVGQLGADFIVGSAHKFHGPKGIGFLYAKNFKNITPLINGGSQENYSRGGTENVAGIIGLAKALELAYQDLDADTRKIQALKQRMIGKLKSEIPGIVFNGHSADADKSLYTVLSVSLPPVSQASSALYYLDSHHIYASGGSACTSYSTGGSHVLQALNYDFERTVIRFSFSRFNTESDIDKAVQHLVLSCCSPEPDRRQLVAV